MKVVTTFWTEQKFEFTDLLYIDCKTDKVQFEVKLNLPWAVYQFFKDLERFVQTTAVRQASYTDQAPHYQFAVLKDGKVTPIVWFDLVISDNLTVSHDIAFETTLLRKNGVIVPLGAFPFRYPKTWHWPVHREFKLKKQAYRYIANKVKKTLW